MPRINLYLFILTTFFVSSCMNSTALNERFALQCEKAGFKKTSNVYRLCIENKKDIYRLEQSNNLKNLNSNNTTLTNTSGNTVSFSATFRLN